MQNEGSRPGQVHFSPEPGKVDFSGSDFSNMYFGPPNSLDHTYLNGVVAINCTFDTLSIAQVELAESEIIHCDFSSVDMSGTDLVGTSARDSVFRRCSFVEGEWRQSHFHNCSFYECDFDNTTINLCIFESCSFDKDSIASFNQMGKSYNTFFGCDVPPYIENGVVLSRNFALPGRPGRSVLVKSDDEGLEAVCFDSSFGRIDIEKVIIGIERELIEFNHGRLRRLRIEFIGNIIAQLARTRKISPASILYITDLFSHFARRAASDSDLRIAMSAALGLRTAVYDASTSVDNDHTSIDGSRCRLMIAYDETLEEVDAITLAGLLTAVAPKGVSFSVFSIVYGSTTIEIAIYGVLTLGALLKALNFVLRQATVTVRTATELKWAAKELLSPIQPIQHKGPRALSSQANAIERNDGLRDDQIPGRAAVRSAGRRVGRLDKRARVSIDIDQAS